MSKKRKWQIVAAIVCIIGIVLAEATSVISSSLSDGITILFITLGMSNVVIGAVSFSILQFYC